MARSDLAREGEAGAAIPASLFPLHGMRDSAAAAAAVTRSSSESNRGDSVSARGWEIGRAHV